MSKKQIRKINHILHSSSKIKTKQDKFKIKFHRCYLCGEWLNPYTSNIDHIIPKAERGLDVDCNKMRVHTQCNLKKQSTIDDTKFNGVSCIQASKLLYHSSKAKTLLLQKVFQLCTKDSIKLSQTIMTLQDYNNFKELCNVYKIDVRPANFKIIGFVPKETKLLKFNNAFMLSNTEMNILSEHLINAIIA